MGSERQSTSHESTTRCVVAPKIMLLLMLMLMLMMLMLMGMLMMLMMLMLMLMLSECGVSAEWERQQ